MTNKVKSLTEFVNLINEGVGIQLAPSSLEKQAHLYGQAAEASLKRQWSERENGNTLRVSSLGRPAVLQALTTFGYHEAEYPNRLRRIFTRGDVDEAELIALMNAHGLPVVRQQEEIEWNGVLGHTDGEVFEGGEFTIFDIKTTQPYKFDKWKKSGIDNDAYITQIAVYQEATKAQRAAIVVSNKANSELTVQYFTPEELEPYKTRALRVVEAIRSLDSVNDIFSSTIIQAPPVERHICKRKAVDGVFTVPESMRYSPFRSVFYKTYSEKNCYSKLTEYVEDYRFGNESIKELERLLAGGKVIKS